MTDIDYNVKGALNPQPEGEGDGPVFICECGQRTRVKSMSTPLNTVVCVACGRTATTMPNGGWEF